MNILKKVTLPIIVIICYISIFWQEAIMSDREFVIPGILLFVYFFLVLGYKFIYNINLNLQLVKSTTIKLPELRIVTNILLFTFSTVIVLFTSWHVIPLIAYKDEVYERYVDKNITSTTFKGISDDLYETLNADEIYFYDSPNIGINQDYTIKYMYFKIVVIRDGEEKDFYCLFIDNILTVSNTYYVNDFQYLYYQGAVELSFTYYDEVNIINNIDALHYSTNDSVKIYPRVSAYKDYQEIGVSPSNSETVYLISLDGTSTEITEYSEYNEANYYIITITRYNDDADPANKKITYIYELESN